MGAKEDHLIALAKEWKGYQTDIAELEEKLKEAKARLRELLEREIPDALDDMDMEVFNLPNGTALSCPIEFVPVFKEEDRPKVFAWLDKHGYGIQIKHEVRVDFGMGEKEADLAAKFINFVTKNLPGRVKLHHFLHDGTSKVVARDIAERGLSLPGELSILSLRKTKLVKTRMPNGS